MDHFEQEKRIRELWKKLASLADEASPADEADPADEPTGNAPKSDRWTWGSIGIIIAGTASVFAAVMIANNKSYALVQLAVFPAIALIVFGIDRFITRANQKWVKTFKIFARKSVPYLATSVVWVVFAVPFYGLISVLIQPALHDASVEFDLRVVNVILCTMVFLLSSFYHDMCPPVVSLTRGPDGYRCWRRFAIAQFCNLVVLLIDSATWIDNSLLTGIITGSILFLLGWLHKSFTENSQRIETLDRTLVDLYIESSRGITCVEKLRIAALLVQSAIRTRRREGSLYGRVKLVDESIEYGLLGLVADATCLPLITDSVVTNKLAEGRISKQPILDLAALTWEIRCRLIHRGVPDNCFTAETKSSSKG